MKALIILIIVLFLILSILFNLLLFGLLKCAKKKQPEMKERIAECLTENN